MFKEYNERLFYILETYRPDIIYSELEIIFEILDNALGVAVTKISKNAQFNNHVRRFAFFVLTHELVDAPKDS